LVKVVLDRAQAGMWSALGLVETRPPGLAAGLLDELEIHVVPVLLGQGRRLFDNLPEHIELRRTRIVEGENSVTQMHYRVQP
jgi:hypothetical protein